MTLSDWSAAQYLKFVAERTRPARDLLAQIPLEAPERVVDIGCGPGNSTELLIRRWPKARVLGLDSSSEMVAKAKARLPGVEILQADAALWTPEEKVDVIFANAVFQWVKDHPAVLRKLLGFLKPGGALAVQMPDSLGEPSHLAMAEAALGESFARKLAGTARRQLARPSAYYDLLRPHAASLDVWRTSYHHPLEGPEGIVEWVKGTGLRPYLDRLEPEEQAVYLARYRALIARAYPADAGGVSLLRFSRLFIVAAT